MVMITVVPTVWNGSGRNGVGSLPEGPRSRPAKDRQEDNHVPRRNSFVRPARS